MKLYTYFIMTVVAILMLLPSNTFTQINLSKVDTHQSGQGIPSGIKREQKKETPIIETKIDPSQSGQGIPSGIKQERKKETPIIETKIDSSQSGQGIPHGIKQEQKKKSPIIDSSGFKKKHNLISIVNYNVYDCYWGDAIDGDGDGYTRYRKLYTDVDVDDGSTRSIYLKIYRKLATSSTYSLYFTTPNYQITGTSSDDWIWVAIGLPNPELDHNIYDFKSEAYEAGGSTVVASRDADADADLNDESFETASQDVSGIYSVYDCYWGDAVDGDGDGYTRYRKLYSDVDVNDGSTRSIYLKIYRKLATSSTYSLYYTTSNYQITGTSGDDWIWVAIGLPNPELDHNIYDFKSEAYEAGGSAVVASRDADTDTDLNDKWFETASQDVPNSVNETEITLSDKYILTENYPNPFNPTTNFKFQIKKNGFVTLNIFDMLGKEIAVLVKEELHAGVYSTTWNAINTISGVYFYRLQVSEEGKNVFTETKKLVLMK